MKTEKSGYSYHPAWYSTSRGKQPPSHRSAEDRERIAELGEENGRLKGEFLAVARALLKSDWADPPPPGEPPWAGKAGKGRWWVKRIDELEKAMKAHD